jgi:hypothetical protein
MKPIVIAAVAILGLAGCGSIAGQTSGCLAASCANMPSPAPSTSDTTATAHGWTTTATLGYQVVEVKVVVSGPLTIEGGCVPALSAWLVGPDGQQVPAPATQSPAVRCLGIALTQLPEGQAQPLTATLPRPAPGTYSVHGLVRVHLPIGAGARVRENIPVVSITVS